jgi:hypothetical protein
MRELYLKEQEETQLKNEKKVKAKEALNKWAEDRKRQIAN